MRNQQINDVNQLILLELNTLKRLAIYALTRWGATQGEIGRALGIDQGSVSRMMGAANGKKRKRSGR